MSTRKGFVVVTADGKYVMSLADKRYTECESLAEASVYDMRQLAAILQGDKKNLLRVDNELQTVVMVEAYSTRMVKLGIPPVGE